jgi:hypothetical protein
MSAEGVTIEGSNDGINWTPVSGGGSPTFRFVRGPLGIMVTSAEADLSAQARLIAAAPEMLALLQELTGRWYVDDMADLQNRAAALLARIDGKP